MFSRCKYCNKNHDRGIAHLYSQSHKKQMKYILKKYRVKIKNAKSEVKEPVIAAKEWKTGDNFWCHFCEVDLAKDLLLDEATVKNWSLLQHISSKEHAEKVEIFWKFQRIRDQDTEKYCLNEKLFSEYEHLSAVRVKEYITNRYQVIKKKATELKLQTEERTKEAFMIGSATVTSISRDQQKHGQTYTARGDHTKGYRTIAAMAHGLTCISIPSDKRFKGNIYTGMTPPWEINEEPSTSGKELGPSIEDYEKHLEYERKRKLPACRVGANNVESGGPNWMPSFGRVWSKNRRQHQRKWLSRKEGENSFNRSASSYQTYDVSTEVQSYGHNSHNPSIHSTGNSGYGFNEASFETSYNGSNSTPLFNDSQRSTSTSLYNDSQRPNDLASSHQSSLPSRVPLPAAPRGYVRKKHSNNIGSGRIEVASNLL